MTELIGEIIGAVLELFFAITEAMGMPSYALAIFLLTLTVKIVLHPTIVSQQRNAKAMTALQPKVEAIKQKYANNKEKQNQMLTKLYQDGNIKPLKSCLPMLIQMPILLILFYGMRYFEPVYPEYYNFLWIQDLSLIIANTQYSLVLPIVCGLTTFLQQFLGMGKNIQSNQKLMMVLFPLMFVWIAQSFPAGLALYWIFYGLLTALQMLWVNYRIGMGIFAYRDPDKKEEEERREQAKANKEAAQKAKEEKAKAKKAKKAAAEAGIVEESADIPEEEAEAVETTEAAEAKPQNKQGKNKNQQKNKQGNKNKQNQNSKKNKSEGKKDKPWK